MAEKSITVTCDRCKQEVGGEETKTYTKGFYRITDGSRWAWFADDGESVLCDACMKADARYIATYGCSPESRAIVHQVT